MRTEIKAIVVSVVVLAVCLAAVGGITYSWFSDTEQSDVDVTTGTLSVETSDYVLTDVGTGTQLATGTQLPAEIKLSNVVANREYTVSYKVTFTHSVDAVYRVAMNVSGIEQSQEKYVVTSISAKDSGNTEVDLSQWTPGATADSPTAYDVIVTVKTAAEYGNGLDASIQHSFEINIINEIYQGDAFSSDTVTSVVSEGDNEISVYDQTEGSSALSATISFAAGTDGASVDQTMTVSATSPEDYTVSDGSVALAGIDVTSSLGGSALQGVETKITFVIDGQYDASELLIYHDGTRFETNDLAASYDMIADTTTVSFTTSAGFSAYFVAVMPEAKVGDTTYINLQDALNAAKSGETVTLAKDVTGGVVIENANSFSIDLNDKTLDSGTANSALIVRNGTVTSITNGTIIGVNYGLVVQNNANVGVLNCTIKATYADAVRLQNQSSIGEISGGVYHGYTLTDFDDYQKTFAGSFGLYIGSDASVNTISGGEFQGTSASFRNYGTIESVTGGKFMNPLIDDKKTTFSDINELVVFYNNAPKSVTGGVWFNQGTGKITPADGYEFSQTIESVSYEGVTCHVKPTVTHSGTYYFYEVKAAAA